MNSLTAIKQIAKIGNLDSLNTKVKESVILAINENTDNIVVLQDKIDTNKIKLELNIDSINEIL